jgi:hypothetical protein
MLILETSYALPDGAAALSHARIAHAGNWHTGAPVASSTNPAAAYSADAPQNGFDYDTWLAAALPATWELDCVAPVVCDYCAIAAHSLGTSGATIQVQAWSGSAWEDIPGAAASPDDNAPLFFLFTPRTGERFRVYISGAVVPFVGVIRFGLSLQMEERAKYAGFTPLPFRRRITTRGARSQSGAWLGRVKVRTGASLPLEWADLSLAWCMGPLLEFTRALEENACFIAWRPDYLPGEVVYAWHEGQAMPAPVDQGDGGGLSFSVTVEVLTYD